MMKNKVVLVTGASRGIGKVTALLSGKEGATVVVNYVKNKRAADDVVRAIKKMGSDAIAIGCDVSDEMKVKEMINTIVKRFGRIDILVNNAGIVFDVPFFEITSEHWKRTLDVNLIGMFFCCKYAALHMLKQKSGSIVNVASVCGFEKGASPDAIDYSATKAGIINLTTSVAKQLAPLIRVNCVSPGWIDTDMNKDLPKEYAEGEMKRIALKRWAKPEEVAQVILFLASDKASYVHGSNFVVDGGLI